MKPSQQDITTFDEISRGLQFQENDTDDAVQSSVNQEKFYETFLVLNNENYKKPVKQRLQDY